nr:N-acetyltransferase eco [Leptinotarsa decemlineata]XP_023012494.1 N-acetyltransferase eco [Leptinotarsa decemlineata]
MNAVRSEQSTTIHERTPHIFHRRRSLFPPDSSDSESDSDLGHISPISFDSCFGPEDLQCCILKHNNGDNLLFKADTIGDYNILGVVDIGQYGACTPTNVKCSASETMSPLYLSPHIKKIKDSSQNVLNETPSKISPSYKLKTPHDTSNTNTKLPKLVRKSLLDSSEIPSNKRKLSPYNSPKQTKHIKLDPKNSKVRTTLFPEDSISLSTNQFYPKTEDIMEKILTKKEDRPKSHIFFNTSRKTKSRKRIGQINAGVGHKIRKPRQKKSKKTILKAAMSVIGNSSITDYIMDLKEMKCKNDSVPLIANKENAKPAVIQHQVIPSTTLSKQKQMISSTVTQEKLITCATITKNTPTEESKKRPMSPEPEPDSSKKFFKHLRSKGVVKMNKNIKLEVGNGKVTLLEKPKIKDVENQYDLSDLVSDEPDLIKADIESVISSLEDEECPTITKSDNKITLQAHSSVVASDNSIFLHQQPPCPASVILSPISQMCDDTSGLALSSPKMAKNLTSVLNRMPNAAQNIFKMSVPPKNNELFPIFCGTTSSVPEKKLNKGSTSTDKKFRKLCSTQMLLDAGQKRFGVTQCPECDIVYHMGDPSDEIMHLHYHNSGHILRFHGWKNERIVADFQNNGRIIQIVPTDSKSWWKKANDLMGLINQEMGCYNMEFPLDNCQV